MFNSLVNIIDEAVNIFVRAGQLSTEMALNTMEYLSKELEYIPWVTAQRQISYLDYMLRKTDLYGQFQVSMSWWYKFIWLKFYF